MSLSLNPKRSAELKLNSGFGPSEEALSSVYIGEYEISEDYLIVFVDLSINVLCAINLDSTARFPIKLNYKEVLAQLETEQILLFEMDWPKEALQDIDSQPEWRREKCIERYALIGPLVDDLENVLRNDYGQGCFQSIIKETGKSKQTVYDCFYAFLRMGRRKSGLSFPIGKNSNHIPKQRKQYVKPGRPSRGIARGKLLNERDFDIFKKGLRWYGQRNGPSILYVYNKLLRKHYHKSRVKNDFLTAEKTGERFKVVLLPPDEIPSYNQFYYWLVKQFGGNLPKRDKSRQNAIENKKDNAGRTGNAYMHVIGPGQVFELDETPFTEELVSVFDPSRSTKIGKGTLYFIIDVFTKLIVGLFITTENPSYNTVKQAIFNAGRDKQGWFDELGFNFNAKYWPQSGVPTIIFVDKAEFHNKVSEGPIADLPVVLKFSRSGRGDDKPNIEQLFHIFLRYFMGVSQGNQTKSQQDIARQVARKNACLTIPELYQIAIVYVLYHNNNRKLPKYPLEREMVRDKVPAIPVKLWEWGMKNRPGYLINVPEDELYMKLLAKGEMTVHKYGLFLKDKGLLYNCDWTLASGIQERKLKNQRCLTLACRYNAELVDIILICTDDGLKLATLDHKDNRFAGLSFAQVAQQKDKEFKEDALAAEEEIQYLLGVDEFIEQKLLQANKEKVSGSVPNISKIKDNRKFEALLNRHQDMHRFLQVTQKQVLPQIKNPPYDQDVSEHKGYAEFDEDDE